MKKASAEAYTSDCCEPEGDKSQNRDDASNIMLDNSITSTHDEVGSHAVEEVFPF